MVTEASLTLLATAPQDNNLRQMAQATTRILSLNAHIQVPAQPSALLYRGQYQWLTGHHQPAKQTWYKALTRAQALQTPYEEGLAYYFLGSHFPIDQAYRLNQAATIFAKIGSHYYQQQAENKQVNQ